MITEFLLSPFLGWFPKLVFWPIFLAATFFYVTKTFAGKRAVAILGFGIGFRFVYALVLTLGQYFVWSADPLAKNFLKSPLDSSLGIPLVQAFPWIFNSSAGYFLFYTWGRFWLNFFITLTVAAAFWFFLKLLRRHRERFFEEGEIELGFLCAVITGWPGVLIFLAAAFLTVIVFSLCRRLVFGEEYTTLGYPMLLAVLAVLLWGNFLLDFTGLSVLKI